MKFENPWNVFFDVVGPLPTLLAAVLAKWFAMYLGAGALASDAVMVAVGAAVAFCTLLLMAITENFVAADLDDSGDRLRDASTLTFFVIATAVVIRAIVPTEPVWVAAFVVVMPFWRMYVKRVGPHEMIKASYPLIVLVAYGIHVTWAEASGLTWLVLAMAVQMAVTYIFWAIEPQTSSA